MEFTLWQVLGCTIPGQVLQVRSSYRKEGLETAAVIAKIRQISPRAPIPEE
jgi:hypothetical protein